MLPAIIHRKWAREYLDRADRAQLRSRKLTYLRLAVNNCVRAQDLEAKEKANPVSQMARPIPARDREAIPSK